MAKNRNKNGRKNYTSYNLIRIKRFKENYKYMKSQFPGNKIGTRVEDYAVYVGTLLVGLGSTLGVSNFTEDQLYSMHDSYLAEGICKYRNITNYFITPDTAEFCASCISDFTKDYHSKLPGEYTERVSIWAEENLEEAVDAMLALSLKNKPNRYELIKYGRRFLHDLEYLQARIFHFHKTQSSESILVVNNAIGDPVGQLADLLFKVISPSGISIQPIDSQKRVKALTKTHMAGSSLPGETKEYLTMVPYSVDQANFITRFVYGFAIYAEEFPELIVPTTSKHFGSVNLGNSFKALPNDFVLTENRHRRDFGAIPHWRNGTYRLLSHPCFVNKQGQRIYVKGAFIKGRAQTALLDEAI